MSKVNFSLTTSIDETKQLIKSIGTTNTVIVVSEPGVGKSTILEMLKAEMGEDEYDYIYVDCPVKDMMDIAASIPNHESKTLEYYVSSLFKMGNGKKKVIMLDEFMKSPKLMQIIYTRLMLERSVGDEQLPAGSIVFATSNNASDGVGDGMLAHVGNRVCLVSMRKPNHDEWNTWASANGIARPIRAWAAMNTKAFKSYLDPDQQDNPYIFKPSSTNKSFVSPRSLAKCSPIVEKRSEYSENALTVALAGTAGEAFAKSIAAFISLEGRLTKYEDIIKNPKTISVPDNVSALVMMLFEAIDKLDTQDTLNKYMDFVNRIPQEEIQSIFFTMMMRAKPKLARYNQEINKWATDNHQLL
jgi:hypothetical protein